MSLSQTPSATTPRTAWPRIAVTAGLLLASVLTIINSVQLARLPAQTQSGKQVMAVQALMGRVDTLEQRVDTFSRSPKPITRSDFDRARKKLGERLSRVEQLQGTDARSDDVLALQARVADIEAGLKKSTLRHTTSRHIAKTTKPLIPQPPFDVVGVELRGGERFLTITSPGATSLPQVHLLREGEAADGWQLRTIEAHSAVFRVDGREQRVAVP